MKRVLAFLLALPLAAALGLFLYGWWHDRGFFKDHPPPGRFHASAHAIDALGQEPPPPPPVVFIHGNPGSCLDFEPVMQQLSPQLRSYAFDRPGYGWSPRPEPVMGPRAQARFLHDAIRELGLVKPVIAGFSYGGPVALAYALDYPDDVSALVLIAALGNPDEKHAMGGSQALLLEPYGPPIAWALGSLLAPDAVSEGLHRGLLPQARRPRGGRARPLAVQPPRRAAGLGARLARARDRAAPARRALRHPAPAGRDSLGQSRPHRRRQARRVPRRAPRGRPPGRRR
ncbi:MAG: alpha/beta fold hydrolase [Archangiaceae bacterium]|nr:alpha/beta fold hydrolase [Archangiaceae bacterium]